MTPEQLLPYVIIALILFLIIQGKASKPKASKLDNIYLQRFNKRIVRSFSDPKPINDSGIHSDESWEVIEDDSEGRFGSHRPSMN